MPAAAATPRELNCPYPFSINSLVAALNIASAMVLRIGDTAFGSFFLARPPVAKRNRSPEDLEAPDKVDVADVRLCLRAEFFSTAQIVT